METETTAAAPAERRALPLTPALLLGVAGIGALFAFESAWYPHWYALFRVVHVVGAVFWIGGGMLITILGLRAQRANDPEELARIARQAAFAGERLFAPAGGIVFLAGLAMMINTDWGWGKFWVVVGLIGFASTMVTGSRVLSPMAKKVDALLTEKGPEAPETQAAIRSILTVARIDIAVLVLVVADMVTKPFS